MARKTKQEAQATRGHILDAAELVFEEHGVSGATLHDIAQAAGLTRGAIYWHFKGKADLFSAMMDRVRLPLEQSLQRRDGAAPAEPLRRIRDSLVVSLRTVARKCSTISFQSRCPCSASITTQSIPSATAISVTAGASSVTHSPKTGSSRASFCRRLRIADVFMRPSCR